MQTVYRILINTPPWVFVLLAYLVWQGVQSLRTQTRPVWRLLIVPLVFFVMGLSRLATRHQDSLWPLLCWVIAAVVLGSFAFARDPGLIAIDKRKGLVTRAGSVAPLIRNVTVFLLQYAVAVATVMRFDNRTAIAILSFVVSGASAGYFAGWAASILRRYRSADSAGKPD